MKIITICGSLRFQREMMEIAEQLEFSGHCVLSVTYPARDKSAYTADELAALGEIHLQKIRLSDAIYVVNPGGYIGDSTQREIAFARSLQKEILSLEPLACGE